MFQNSVWRSNFEHLQRFPTLKNRDFLKINEGQFCPRCPAGGPDLEKSLFFLNKRRSVLSPLPCGRPRPWKIVIFCIYTFFFTLQNCLICLVLSIGSMLVFLVLKNAVECTSQRLKRTSGAWVMIIFHAGPMYRKTDGQKNSRRL